MKTNGPLAFLKNALCCRRTLRLQEAMSVLAAKSNTENYRTYLELSTHSYSYHSTLDTGPISSTLTNATVFARYGRKRQLIYKYLKDSIQYNCLCACIRGCINFKVSKKPKFTDYGSIRLLGLLNSVSCVDLIFQLINSYSLIFHLHLYYFPFALHKFHM